MADEANWHLMTVTYGGTVSLIKGLTKAECDTMVAKLPTPQSMRVSVSQDGFVHPWPTEEQLKAGGSGGGSGGVYYATKVPDGWIRTVECFQ